MERAEGPGGCLRSSRSWVARALRIRRTLNHKLVLKREANNGTRGQRRAIFEGKPCRFNMIGDVTGTRRVNGSRTEEQGHGGHPGSRKIVRDTNRTLPEVEGLLE